MFAARAFAPADARPMNTNNQNQNGTPGPESREKFDVYQIVTDRIIELLEAGTVPWNKPWKGNDQFPMNLVSKKLYRGVNIWMLHCAGFGSPYWVSYKQARDLGGFVKAGEKSSIAVFWKRFETKDKTTGEKKFIPLLRYYRVFNVEQCDGLNYPKPEGQAPLAFNPIETCESIVAGMPNPPTIRHGEARAYYRPAADVVNMPAKEIFDAETSYYATLLHELAHATGHESRLNRKLEENEGFGSSKYAKEELIAEMASSFLCGKAGIVNSIIDNSAAYIANWLQVLKNDRKLVVQAAGAAHRAADHILAVKYETTEAAA